MAATTQDAIKVLLVEDNADDAAIVERLLRAFPDAPLRVQAVASAEECQAQLKSNGFDVVILDYRLPREDGLTFLRRVRRRVDAPPIIVLTGQGDERLAVEAMRAGAYDYLSKGAIASDQLGRAIMEALRRFRRHEAQHAEDEQILFALVASVAEKDATTGGHVQRLARYAVQLGRALGLDEHDLLALRYGASLHDIGKIAVRERVLQKPGRLTDDEWDEVRQHPIVGERICCSLAIGPEIAPIVRHHHERWDGSGYVDGLAGEEIPRLARVVSVVDAFDAMTSDRPYRRALPLGEALRRLERGAGSYWDPMITRSFLDLVRREGWRRAA